MLLMHNLSLNSFQKMESAICLRYCPIPYGPKGFHGANPSRFLLKINHATPLSLPQISTTRSPVTRSFGHANCMLERFSSVPSENEGSGNKILRGVTLSSLVLTCVLGLFSFGGKNMNPKLTTAYASPYDKIASLFVRETEAQGSVALKPRLDGAQGSVALKSLLEIPSDAELADTQKKRSSNFGERGPSQLEVNNLKWLAMGLSKSPDRSKALKTLTDQYKYCKAHKITGESEQYLELAMVELSMFKGKFEEALGLLNDIIGENVEPMVLSELHKTAVEEENHYEELRLARLILYKAIVHTVLEQKERDQWWEAFMQTCRQ
ncbi:hypothetical protein HKD37_08G021349 [Glycine soja]